jgi:purine-binding chemotaxis protein CheW
VREVVPLKDLIPLPGTPPFVAGIISLRGQLLSVIDLKCFFELPARGLTDLHQVIVLRQAAMELGVLADEVTGVRTVGAEEIGPALLTAAGIRAEYLRGVTGEPVAVLDAARILADPKLVVNDR